MAKRTVSDCIKAVKEASAEGSISDKQAEELLTRVYTLAEERGKKHGLSIDRALREIAGELEASEALVGKLDKRQRLLSIQARRKVIAQARRFTEKGSTYGDGLRSFLVGNHSDIEGSRNSVDYQFKSIHGKYLGRLVSRLEEFEVFKEFNSGKLDKEIFQELYEYRSEGGTPGISGNKAAKLAAQAIHEVVDELVSRQNRAGAYIRRLPGYIIRQTHDIDAIRGAGSTKEESFKKWSQFIYPLLDHEKTFQGNPSASFLRNVHANLYAGVHHLPGDEAEVDAFALHGALAKKVSASRVLHFKDAQSAWAYNQAFGSKGLRDGIMADLLFRARSIALMENLGPNPQITLDLIRRDLLAEARDRHVDSAKQADSLKNWSIDAAIGEVTGFNDHPHNFTLARKSSTIRAIAQMAKMGGVVLSSLGDKAFLQLEMARQGISGLQTLVKQITGLAGRSAEQKRHLRLMGVAMDGLIGNTIQRYSIYHNFDSRVHKVQQKFYDLNFMNWWNDVNKATAAELMSANLGSSASQPFDQLSPELKTLLPRYNITEIEWEAMRKTVYDIEGNPHLSPDQLSQLTDSDIQKLVLHRGWVVTPANITRMRDELETKLRTFFLDRIDIGVPTPGAHQGIYTKFGTQAGTPLGEAVRLLMLFKSFPITVLSKVMAEDIYGRGNKTVGQWFANDHKGKFYIASLIAMTTIGGYLSGAIKDALKGREPKPLINEDGSFNVKTLNEAALRGGGLGILGDFLFTEYDQTYNSFMGVAAGPVIGQLDPLMSIYSGYARGENMSPEAVKLAVNNTPFINLFYIRPVLDYYILWNLNEMLSPGYAERMVEGVKERNNQDFFVDPVEAVK